LALLYTTASVTDLHLEQANATGHVAMAR
jgi:hypothetical protein